MMAYCSAARELKLALEPKFPPVPELPPEPELFVLDLEFAELPLLIVDENEAGDVATNAAPSSRRSDPCCCRADDEPGPVLVAMLGAMLLPKTRKPSSSDLACNFSC